jgi:4-hydroxy-3-polyprenylbenzoate decarboxylase
MRITVGISGASGAVYGVRVLQALAALEVETELVVSNAAAQTLRHELDLSVGDVTKLATRSYPIRDIGAAISSGSYRTDGMIVAPCSVKTLSAIVNSYDDNLLVRAADVTLKERRLLVLLFRETPLHLGHLRLLTSAAELGAQVFPPVPSFYHRPSSLDDVIDQTVSRVLDQFGLDTGFARWRGTGAGGGGDRRTRDAHDAVELP